MKTKKLAQTALLCAVAIIFGYIESLFPLPIPIPGIKLGISNLVLVFALYRNKNAVWFIMLIKVAVTSLLFAGMSAFLYSLAGGIASVAGMVLFYKTKKFSVISVSIAGGILHNAGQLFVAALLLTDIQAAYWLPFLVAAGGVSGALLGIVCRILFLHIPPGSDC